MDIVFIAVLICFSAVFSATETAFSSANKIRLKNLAASGNKNAGRAIKIIERFDKALTAILVGNNIVNIASASLATVAFTRILGEGSVGIATAVMTVAVLIFGEVIPKSLASEHAESFAMLMSTPLSMLITILTPVIFLFSCLKKLVNKIVGTKSNQPSVTEEELMYLVEEIEDEGVLEEHESNLVRSALEFDEITIEEILVPRVNIVAVSLYEDVEKIKEVFIEENYSRLPVYDKNIDDIVGIIRQPDFYEMYLSGGKDISQIMKKPLYISEYKRISEVLMIMQKSKVHMAIVVDQYGGTEGIVTLEDIIEELVGEIYDESDDEDRSFVKISDCVCEVSGEYSLTDALEKMELPDDLIDTDCNSVGGWFMDLAQHIPENDESVTSGIFKLTAIEADEMRVKRILMEIDKNIDNEDD
ncbi:MAG: HlyC/CorC family transporter [Ruminococcus sp.]|nr:HlyC/CorC family transporter [Ruminococcus sp.]